MPSPDRGASASDGEPAAPPTAVFDAFISYSHAAGGRLAPALQSALHRFGRPWYRLRELHVFRDQTNLAVNPHLWSTIADALDHARWFILLASETAAASPWVGREVRHWIERHGTERILIVLTSGSLRWDAGARAFDPAASPSLPPPLLSAFGEEPLYLDLAWAQDAASPSLHDPRFRDAVAAIAAALTGRPKDELIGEDVARYRAAQRLAGGAIAALAALAAAAGGAAWRATVQADAARRERAVAVEQSRIASGRRLAAQSVAIRTGFADQLPLATLLAIESTRLADGAESAGALRAALGLLPEPMLSAPGDGAQARVRALAFSPDGMTLAAARDDGAVDLFDVAAGRPVRSLPQQDEPVAAVAFSGDGRSIATGGGDGRAVVWSAADGEERLVLQHDGGVAALAFDPRDRFLATGSKDGWARVWDLASGREVFRRHHGAEVRAVAFDRSGRRLAAIDTDGGVSLVDVAGWRLRRRWQYGDAGLALDFGRDGTRLATANGERAAVWDVASGKLLFSATHATGSRHVAGLRWIDAVALSPDGTRLASAGRDGTARVWDLALGEEALRFDHGAPVASIAFSPDGALLAAASTDGSARLWDLARGTERLRASHPGGAEIVVFSADGRRIASGAVDGDVAVWSDRPGAEHARFADPAPVQRVAAAADGSTVATAAAGTIRLWPADGSAPRASLRLPVPTLDRLVLGDGDRVVAAWSRSIYLPMAASPPPAPLVDPRAAGALAIGTRFAGAFDRERGALRLWRLADGAEIAPLPMPDPERLAVDPTGSYVAAVPSRAAGGEPGAAIDVWSVEPRHEVGRIAGGAAGSLAVGSGARFVAMLRPPVGGDRAARLEIHRLAGGGDPPPLPVAVDARLAIDPFADRLAVIEDATVRLVDLQRGTLVATLAHRAPVDLVQWSEDRQTLLTLAAGTARLWRVESGALLLELGTDGRVADARFADHGRYVLTAGPAAGATLWPWRADDLRDAACARLTRNLDRDEWRQYLGDLPYRRTCDRLPTAGPS